MADTRDQLEHKLNQLEHKLNGRHRQMGTSIDASRNPANPVDPVDQSADFAQVGSAADFLRNLARDMRDHPLPLLLIGAGVTWAVIASATRRLAPARRPHPISEEEAAANTAPLIGVPGWEQPAAPSEGLGPR